MKKSFFIIFLFLFQLTFAENKIDSLENQLQSNSGIRRANILVNLATLYQSISLERMNSYYNEAIKIAAELKDEELLKSVYYKFGKDYYMLAKYDLAVASLLKGLDLAEKTPTNSLKIKLMYLLGIINRDTKNYDKSYTYFKQAANDAFAINETTDYLLSRNEIANLLYIQKKYNEALKEKKNILDVAKEKNNAFVILCCSHDIGIILEEIGNKREALKYYLESNKIENNMNYPREIIIGYLSTARVYNELGEYGNAIEFCQKSLRLAQKHNIRKEIMDATELLSNIYAAKSDFPEAYNYLARARVLKDSIFTEESSKQLNELQTKYETERKNKEIEYLKEVQESQSNLRNLLVIVILLILIIAFIIYRQLLQKRKTASLLQSKNDALENANIKLAESETNLKELNATKDKFFSIISHDLRNPFISIIGMSDILIEDFNDLADEERINFIRQINSAGKFTHHLLENLLNWAGMQTSRITVSKTNFNLQDLIDEIIHLNSSNAKIKSIELLSSVEENSFVYADRFMIDTVIRNLVSNSIKFTNQGGKVRVASGKKDDKIIITIEDNGIGIHENNLKKLFHIENQVKSKGTAGESGSGLGLILCKEFVEKNDGTLKVESEHGKGSRFIITLTANGL